MLTNRILIHPELIHSRLPAMATRFRRDRSQPFFFPIQFHAQQARRLTLEHELEQRHRVVLPHSLFRRHHRDVRTALFGLYIDTRRRLYIEAHPIFVHFFFGLGCKCGEETKVVKLDLARNLGGVQQLAGAWSTSLETRPDMGMSDIRRPLSGFSSNEEEVICPKPRRPTNISCPVNDFIKPSRRRRSQATVRPEGDAVFELLDIFLSKGGCGDMSNFGCSPPYFSGSPPNRSGNPLIHDVEFLQQRAQSVLSHHISSRGPTSFGGNPIVRVEGFASAGPDTRSRVSTLA